MIFAAKTFNPRSIDLDFRSGIESNYHKHIHRSRFPYEEYTDQRSTLKYFSVGLNINSDQRNYF